MPTRTAGVTEVMRNTGYEWDQLQDSPTGWMYDSVLATKVIPSLRNPKWRATPAQYDPPFVLTPTAAFFPQTRSLGRC